MAYNQVPTFLHDKQGRVYLNPAKDYVQPFELLMDEPNQRVTIPAGAQAGPFPMTAQFDGPIEGFYLKALVLNENGVPITDYDIRIEIEHPGKRKLYMNRAVPLRAISGDGGRPYVFPETIFIPIKQSINITLFNDDSAARTVELVMGSIKYYPNSAPKDIRTEMWKYIERRERTYTYFQTTQEPVILTANQVDVFGFVRVPDDADLEIFKLTVQSTGRFRARIRDSQNDRGLMSQKVDASLLFGQRIATVDPDTLGSGGIFPARWPITWMVRRSVQFRTEFDDLSGNPNTINPVFGGRKISYA